MTRDQLEIRPARAGDLAPIVAIYNHAIENGVATFDTNPFTPQEREEWFAQFGGEHPIFVCEREGEVVGYAYYLPYRTRAGYARTKEVTIYIDPNHQGRGVGTALYEVLIPLAKENGIHVLLALLGGKNEASEALHKKFGFELVGHYREVGHKFGDWVDTYSLQKFL